MFSIEIKRLWWIRDDGNDDPEDLCLHGEVIVRIGDESFGDGCCASASALYHLRTLTENHIACYDEHPYTQMLPCCGHCMFEATDGSVDISGCPNGDDWTVHHMKAGVELTTKNGSITVVPFEEYRTNVLAFADQVMAYYFHCQPKSLPKEEFERNAYFAFWREWARRRGIAVEDTPFGRRT